MNILFIVPYVPSRVRVRPYQIIRALSERGHHLTVLTLWTNEQEKAEVDELRKICADVQALPMPVWRSLKNCLQALPGSDPLQSVYSWYPPLIISQMRQKGIAFDAVHVEHLRGARYALAFKENTDLPVIWDSVDCISHLFEQAASQSQDRMRRWRSKFELRRTRQYEAWLIRQFDRVLVTSAVDRDMLQKLGQGKSAPIAVLPNGVDLDYFRFDSTIKRASETLILSGKMSYHANINMAFHMVGNIMPLVWVHRPDVHLMIVGKDPTPEIVQLGQHPNITVTGTVDHLPPFLQRATIAVAPITYNAGIQNKVLEAMACGTPVVTTRQAISPLAARPGRDVMVANSADEFATQILDLLADPEKRGQLSLNGRVYVETNHRWPEVGSQLEQIYTDAISAKKVVAEANISPQFAFTK